MRKTLICTAIATALLSFFPVSGISQAANGATPVPAKPEIVYITNFTLEIGDIKQNSGILKRSGRFQADPEAKAEKLVELLADSLTSALQQKSIPVKRLSRGERVPGKGWLVSGSFLQVDEGNRLRRTVVGFGAGATEMQVEVAVVDLSSGSPEPFIVFGTDASSGKGPGAVVVPNPYVAAAKFVLSKKASEKDVKKTAHQIADTLAECIQDGSHPK